jgi:hypothetical protein
MLPEQVSEVKNIMVDNIEKVLERGEKIELLVDKTDNLRFQVRPAWRYAWVRAASRHQGHATPCKRPFLRCTAELDDAASACLSPAAALHRRRTSFTKQGSSCAARCGGRTCG